MNQEQFQKVGSANGFIAALDQSGGSTPKALKLYGIPEDAYSGDDEMFALVHAMRARIIASPSFGGDRIFGAILFEGTMDRQFGDTDSVTYLWETKHVVPFLKVDKGLAEESDGVQLMKPIPGLNDLLTRASAKGIFGTKMRSVGLLANEGGMKRLVDQQFELARSDPCGRPHPDHRTRDRHPQPREGCSRRASQGRDPRAPGQPLDGALRDAQADAPVS